MRLLPGLRRLAFATFAVAIASLVLLSPAAAQTEVGTPYSTTLVFNSTSEVATFLVDLGSLPARPILVAEVDPQTPHLDLEVELQFEDDSVLFPITCWPGVEAAPPVAGFIELRRDFAPCGIAGPGLLAGNKTMVHVRVQDFGSTPAPASLELVIRGETRVPFGTELIAYQPSLAPQQLHWNFPFKDTTIYEGDPTGSNGGGDALVVGRFGVEDVRSLIAFELAGAIPTSAIIDDARIELEISDVFGGGETVRLFYTAPDAVTPSITWVEGDSEGGLPGSDPSAANWTYRRASDTSWASAGGDVFGPPLDTRSITTFGTATFASPALTFAVADMIKTGSDGNGFLLMGEEGVAPASRSIEFASREGGFGGGIASSALFIDFTPTEPYQGGTLDAGTSLGFVSDGENFRWIYDNDHDDIFETEIGGVCTALRDDWQFLPYSYAYAGSPGYVGLDCCAWQIDSVVSGTIGTGQAIFFHNLDPSNPANLPPDSDGDGLYDNCDNCIAVANGPLQGSCVLGPLDGQLCLSNQECNGGYCSLSQEDSDLDFEGDACPEPGTTVTLAAGILWLIQLQRRARSL